MRDRAAVAERAHATRGLYCSKQYPHLNWQGAACAAQCPVQVRIQRPQLRVGRRLLTPQRIHGKGLEPTEAEIEPGAIGHRPRKTEAIGIALSAQARDLRSPGVSQAEQLGRLVECLTGRIIH